MIQNRIRSITLWTSIVSLIGIILKYNCDVDLKQFNLYADAVLAVVVAMGILNNPTNKNNF